MKISNPEQWHVAPTHLKSLKQLQHPSTYATHATIAELEKAIEQFETELQQRCIRANPFPYVHMNNTTNSIDVAQLAAYKENTLMLNQIGAYVEDFCNDEDTTLVGVMRLLAKYHQLESEVLYQKIDQITHNLQEFQE